jgi:hypothetical protein
MRSSPTVAALIGVCFALYGNWTWCVAVMIVATLHANIADSLQRRRENSK